MKKELEVGIRDYFANSLAASISIYESPMATTLVMMFNSIFSASLKKALVFHSLNPSINRSYKLMS
jgi:hypothetical protein